MTSSGPSSTQLDPARCTHGSRNRRAAGSARRALQLHPAHRCLGCRRGALSPHRPSRGSALSARAASPRRCCACSPRMLPLEEVLITSRRPESRQGLVDRYSGEMGFPLRTVDSSAEIFERCPASSSPPPPPSRRWSPWPTCGPACCSARWAASRPNRSLRPGRPSCSSTTGAQTEAAARYRPAAQVRPVWSRAAERRARLRWSPTERPAVAATTRSSSCASEGLASQDIALRPLGLPGGRAPRADAEADALAMADPKRRVLVTASTLHAAAVTQLEAAGLELAFMPGAVDERSACPPRSPRTVEAIALRGESANHPRRARGGVGPLRHRQARRRRRQRRSRHRERSRHRRRHCWRYRRERRSPNSPSP